MPKSTSRKPKPRIAIFPDLMLEDETNEEYGDRIALGSFLRWMNKHNHRLPESQTEEQRLIYEYLINKERHKT